MIYINKNHSLGSYDFFLKQIFHLFFLICHTQNLQQIRFLHSQAGLHIILCKFYQKIIGDLVIQSGYPDNRPEIEVAIIIQQIRKEDQIASLEIWL